MIKNQSLNPYEMLLSERESLKKKCEEKESSYKNRIGNVKKNWMSLCVKGATSYFKQDPSKKKESIFTEILGKMFVEDPTQIPIETKKSKKSTYLSYTYFILKSAFYSYLSSKIWSIFSFSSIAKNLKKLVIRKRKKK